MQQRLNFNFPCPIRFGAGVIDELADHLLAQGLKHPLIVTDPVIADLDFFKDIVESLKNKNLA